MKGMRVQSIIRELRGEKIDIIEFSEDSVVVRHARPESGQDQPGVRSIDAADKHMEVIVDDTQLSLAIGKKGQNVRLAAKLLGWKIDIKSEEEKRQEVESQMAALSVGAPVSVLIEQGLTEEVVDKLSQPAIGTVEKLGAMTPEELEQIPGIGPEFGGADPVRGAGLLRAVRTPGGSGLRGRTVGRGIPGRSRWGSGTGSRSVERGGRPGGGPGSSNEGGRCRREPRTRGAGSGSRRARGSAGSGRRSEA